MHVSTCESITTLNILPQSVQPGSPFIRPRHQRAASSVAECLQRLQICRAGDGPGQLVLPEKMAVRRFASKITVAISASRHFGKSEHMRCKVEKTISSKTCKVDQQLSSILLAGILRYSCATSLRRKIDISKMCTQ